MTNKITQKTINHGTISRPFAKFHTRIADLMPFYPVHWHEEVEIIRVVEGSGNVCVGGIWLELNKGDILLIPPFVLHTINTKQHNDMVIDTVVFNLRLLDNSNSDTTSLRNFAPMLASAGNNPVLISQGTDINNSIGMSLDTICLTVDDGQGYMLAVKANLYWIFYHLYTNKIVSDKEAKLSPSEDKKLYTIKKILQHIHANYTTNISIDAIATQSGYSPFYIMKVFKQFASSTIVDYINSMRCDTAGIQILSTNLEISQIASAVGFNNISYFNRQFLAQYGTTPKKYRAEYMLEVQ